MTRAVRVAAALVVCSLVTGTFAIGPIAGQTSGTDGEPIDDCTLITEPGKYVVTENVSVDQSGACIQIRSNDVVLDGGGHVVQGPGPSEDSSGGAPAVGVLVDGSTSLSYENVTVENVGISGFDTGIRAGTGGFGDDTSVTLVDVVVTDSGRGIALRGGNTTLSNVTVADSDGGIDAIETGDIRAFDVALRNNGYGLNAAETGNLYVESSVIENNDQNGVGVGPSVSLKSYGLEVSGNGGFGVAANEHGTSVRLNDGEVSDNGDAGVTVQGDAEARLSGMTVTGNGAEGVLTADGGEVTLYGVNATGNDGRELDARDGNATARALRVGPTTNASFNSGPIALEPVDRADLPALPDNRSAVADGLDVNGSEMPVGMAFAVDTDVEAVEVWRHNGSEWSLEGESTVDNGTAQKYNDQDGVFAATVVSNDSGVEDPGSTPTSTDGSSDPADNESDASSDTSSDSSTVTATPNGTAVSNGTATPTDGATATDEGSDDPFGATDTTATDGGTEANTVDEESGFSFGDGPGFGPVAAILAILVSSIVAYRQQ